jgi:hypothetical protein
VTMTPARLDQLETTLVLGLRALPLQWGGPHFPYAAVAVDPHDAGALIGLIREVRRLREEVDRLGGEIHEAWRVARHNATCYRMLCEGGVGWPAVRTIEECGGATP